MFKKFLLLLSILFCFSEITAFAAGSDVTYVVEEDGNVANTYLTQTELNYCKIPENVRTKYQSEGGRIIVSDKNLGNHFGYGFSIKGIWICDFYDDGSKKHTIWIEDRQNAMDTVIHEMGHYVDFESGLVSNSEEFIVIHNDEVNLFSKTFNTHKNNYSTSEEYFAESFQNCYLYPTRMKETCPKTYEYIINLVENFK